MFTGYMDELIKELQSTGIGCYVGHEYFGCVSYTDDMKLLCPRFKGLQQMIEICERFGEIYSVKYNAKKSMCMMYDQFVDRSGQFNDSINMMLNGSRLTWSNGVKHLGKYVKYDLSEYEEIRNTKTDFICAKYFGVLTVWQMVLKYLPNNLTNSQLCVKHLVNI